MDSSTPDDMARPNAADGAGTARFALVLSAGRTGSTFLDHLLKRLYPEADVRAEHEPARTLKMLHNVSLLDLPAISDWARRGARAWFVASRRRWLASLPPGTPLIEINPFLACLGTDLNALPAAASLHMVRHPVGWVRSSISFGSYSWRRPIVPFIPLARERPPFAMRDWRRWSEAERFAWRWKLRNQAILDYAAERTAGLHRLCLYEDLFTGGAANLEEVRAIVGHLGLDPTRLTPETVVPEVVNPSRQRHVVELTPTDESRIMAICGETARRLGYD